MNIASNIHLKHIAKRDIIKYVYDIITCATVRQSCTSWCETFWKCMMQLIFKKEMISEIGNELRMILVRDRDDNTIQILWPQATVRDDGGSLARGTRQGRIPLVGLRPDSHRLR